MTKIPYISDSHRAWLSKSLDDLIEFVGWNLYLMGSREDTFYHIIYRLLDVFYGNGESYTLSIPPHDPEKRELVEKKLRPLIDTIKSNPPLLDKKNGTLNYVVCRILNAFYPREHSRYADLNNAIGVLETALREAKVEFSKRYEANGMIRCAMLEVYRRKVAPYEQDACDLQGDVFD